MPSGPDRSPVSGRTIFSRITSSFSSKSRNIAEFSIELDDDHRRYSQGDVVTGFVRLRVVKPIRVTHIVVCLHGWAQVYRNPGSPGDGYRANKDYLGPGRGKKSGEYFGNGFASLFEDETVLCGDGRLAEGLYQFNFELEFPDRDLPSSIDFERGTITYMITTTMTRPTTVSPTTSYDRKIHFAERIDISPLYPPKSKTITLEALSRRSRARHQARKLVDSAERKSRKTDSAEQGSEQPRQSEVSSHRSTQTDSEAPGSPVESEVSFDSRLSSHGQASQSDSQKRVSPTSSDEARTNASNSSVTNKVITATIESQAGGCLQGDVLPVKVNITHTKVVKSTYGVILTLYRLARVDMHPSIPLGPTEKGKNPKYEDYYPKSMTGLGGLSLTGAGSSHLFRKDMSQSMTPLYIDPQTLTAEVIAKVRVPEEAFPTISTVPGAMISFKYYVEVVVDIQGKLGGQDRSFSTLSGHSAMPGPTLGIDGSDMERSAFTPFGPTIIDTAPIRRDKSVVTSTFEVIIGTKDSERRKGKRKVTEVVAEPAPAQPYEQLSEPQQSPDAQLGAGWYDPNAYYDPRWYNPQYAYTYPRTYLDAGHYYYPTLEGQAYDHPPPPVPTPPLPDESQMTEKQRMQQAEARLLPSQPPGLGAEQTDSNLEEATAPYLPEDAGAVVASNHEIEVAPAFSSSAHVPNANLGDDATLRDMPAVPEYEPVQAGSSRQAAVNGDDKQEIERQQLQEQASAPPEDDAEPSAVFPSAPTAPVLANADRVPLNIHDSHADAVGTFDLPQYER